MFATFVILVGACNDAHAMLGILLLNLHTLVFFCKKIREAQHRSFIVYGLGSMDKGLGLAAEHKEEEIMIDVPEPRQKCAFGRE